MISFSKSLLLPKYSSGYLRGCLLSTAAKTEVKPYDSIPGPGRSELPIVGSLPEFLKTKDGYHQFYYNMHQKYGDVVKFSILGEQYVSVCRPDHIKEAYVSYQSTPLREGLEPWTSYRQDRNIPLGVTMELSQFSQNEEEWRKYRRPIATLLKPDLVRSYVPRVAHVANDLVETMRLTNQKSVNISQLREMTSAYGFEAISAILMGKSMGSLQGGGKASVDPESLRRNRGMMDAVDEMFRVSNKMMFNEFPFWKWFNTSSKKELYASTDKLFELGAQIFHDRHNNKDERFVNDGATDFFDIITRDDFEGGALVGKDLEVTGVELIGAGVDTTSNAAQWVILMMAQRPEVQERLAASIREALGPPQPNTPTRLTVDHLQDLKLYNFVDEVLRLHPVLPQNSRLFDRDVEMFGYKIPAFTKISLNNFTAARDSRNFENPNEFDETRTVRRECPFGSKTFGAGARQCESASYYITVMKCMSVSRCYTYCSV